MFCFESVNHAVLFGLRDFESFRTFEFTQRSWGFLIISWATVLLRMVWSRQRTVFRKTWETWRRLSPKGNSTISRRRGFQSPDSCVPTTAMVETGMEGNESQLIVGKGDNSNWWISRNTKSKYANKNNWKIFVPNRCYYMKRTWNSNTLARHHMYYHEMTEQQADIWAIYRNLYQWLLTTGEFVRNLVYLEPTSFLSQEDSVEEVPKLECLTKTRQNAFFTATASQGSHVWHACKIGQI